jgi:hypothetical protein
MNRLQAELQRLYLSHDTERPDSAEPGLAGPDGRGRAMVLELARPASWDALGKVWQGVQADLELPAPAIAVSGTDGYQLWFSLAQPVPAAQATDFIESLRQRYLGDVAPERVGMHPLAAAAPPAQSVTVLPCVQRAPGRWSAFVTSDLAGLFEDEPWLDLPPSPDAQADLLSRLKSIEADDLKRASERLRSASSAGSSGSTGSTASMASAQAAPAPAVPAGPAAGRIETRSAAAADSADPRRFLLGIMNDPAVELHLRMEAAKALLPYFEGQHPR